MPGGCTPSGDAPATTQAAAAPAAVMGPIVGANVAWGDALVRGDGAVLAAAYTPDAVYMIDSGDVSGPEAIRDWLLEHRARLPDSIHATNTRTNQLDVAGERAYEAGTLTYTLISRSAPETRREVTVRYMTFWLRSTTGAWLMLRSIRPVP